MLSGTNHNAQDALPYAVLILHTMDRLRGKNNPDNPFIKTSKIKMLGKPDKHKLNETQLLDLTMYAYSIFGRKNIKIVFSPSCLQFDSKISSWVF
jgi:hypothetical protein